MRTRFGYTGIRVQDLDRSLRFYVGLLGLTELGRADLVESGGTAIDLGVPGGSHHLELNYYPPGNPFATPYSPGEGLDHLAFQVPDLDAALLEAQEAGHPVLREFRTGRSRWAYIQDPDGNWIELYA